MDGWMIDTSRYRESDDFWSMMVDVHDFTQERYTIEDLFHSRPNSIYSFKKKERDHDTQHRD